MMRAIQVMMLFLIFVALDVAVAAAVVATEPFELTTAGPVSTDLQKKEGISTADPGVGRAPCDVGDPRVNPGVGEQAMGTTRMTTAAATTGRAPAFQPTAASRRSNRGKVVLAYPLFVACPKTHKEVAASIRRDDLLCYHPDTEVVMPAAHARALALSALSSSSAVARSEKGKAASKGVVIGTGVGGSGAIAGARAEKITGATDVNRGDSNKTAGGAVVGVTIGEADYPKGAGDSGGFSTGKKVKSSDGDDAKRRKRPGKKESLARKIRVQRRE